MNRAINSNSELIIYRKLWALSGKGGAFLRDKRMQRANLVGEFLEGDAARAVFVHVVLQLLRLLRV